jgi:hypothetical protein
VLFLVLKEVIDLDTHMGPGIVQLDLFILLTWLWWTCIYLYYFSRTWTTLATIAVMKNPRCSLEADVETLSTDVCSFPGNYPCRWTLSIAREKPIGRLCVGVRSIELYSPTSTPKTENHYISNRFCQKHPEETCLWPDICQGSLTRWEKNIDSADFQAALLKLSASLFFLFALIKSWLCILFE